MLYLTLNFLNAIICWVQFPNFSLSYSHSQHLVLLLFSLGPFPLPLLAWLTLVFVHCLCFIRSPSFSLTLPPSLHISLRAVFADVELSWGCFCGPWVERVPQWPSAAGGSAILPLLLPLFSLTLSFPVFISIPVLPFPVWDTLQIPPLSSLICAQTH